MSDFKRVQHPIFGKYSTRIPGPDDTVLDDEPATDRNGRPLPPEPLALPEKALAGVKLTGAALQEALAERGLPNTGTADEKRAAVAAHDTKTSTQVDDPIPDGGQSADHTQEV